MQRNCVELALGACSCGFPVLVKWVCILPHNKVLYVSVFTPGQEYQASLWSCRWGGRFSLRRSRWTSPGWAQFWEPLWSQAECRWPGQTELARTLSIPGVCPVRLHCYFSWGLQVLVQEPSAFACMLFPCCVCRKDRWVLLRKGENSIEGFCLVWHNLCPVAAFSLY